MYTFVDRLLGWSALQVFLMLMGCVWGSPLQDYAQGAAVISLFLSAGFTFCVAAYVDVRKRETPGSRRAAKSYRL